MYNFCTLFDVHYLSRGLAMYRSLLRQETQFHLYIIAFDDKCEGILKALSLSHATIISLSDFEDADLLRVKPTRSRAEYCWTCSSSALRYCIQHYGLDHCTYLDADLYFFASPSVLYEEMGASSVCITEHRYSPAYNKALLAGKYCVQWVYIKNDRGGMEALEWWRGQCLDWCYNRHEAGRFGDQKYLDQFLERFEGVHELQHLGGGLAPWNLQQYNIFSCKDGLYLRDGRTHQDYPVVFYHFHYFRFLRQAYVDFGRYPLRKHDIELIYKPYLLALQEAHREVQQVDSTVNPHGVARLTAWKRFTRFVAMGFRWDANIYKIDKFG